jgi:hypothetical protein
MANEIGRDFILQDDHDPLEQATFTSMLAIMAVCGKDDIPFKSYIVAVGAREYEGIICLNEVYDRRGKLRLSRSSVGPTIGQKERKTLLETGRYVIDGLNTYKLILL